MSKKKDVYIVAYYYGKPKNPKMTRVAGYMTNPENVAWDEKVEVTHGLKQKDLINAQILLNITQQKVEKNSMGGNRGFYELFEYFYTNSPAQITRALQMFGITVRKNDEQPAVQEDVQGEKETNDQSGNPEAESILP